MSERRIYVASLSDYNNGHLHGAWIDVDGKCVEEIQEEVNAILRGSKYPNVEVECPDCDGKGKYAGIKCDTCHGRGKVPSAEEWAIHDHEGFGGHIGEYTSFKEVAELAELLEQHGDSYLAYIEHVGLHYATEENYNDTYEGEWDSKEAWGDNWLEDSGTLDSIPENLRYYFDVEKWVRDCELGGDIRFVKLNGSYYAFRNS